MTKTHAKMGLMDYVMQLTDASERERVRQAIRDAARVPADKQTIDDVESRFGDGAGSVDIGAYLAHELAVPEVQTEFEALMKSAAVLQVRLAFLQVETPGGPRFVRIDKLQ